MTIFTQFEEFAEQKLPRQPAQPVGVEIHEQDTAESAEAYETGYKAGWDDAIRAAKEEGTHVSTEFARNLRNLGFTFHEARSHVVQSVAPLVHAMVEKVFPRALAETVTHRVLEEIHPLAQDLGEEPVEILVAPSRLEFVSRITEDVPSVPVRVVAEESLTDGQVHLRLGKSERRIDLDEAIARLSQSMRNLAELNREALNHG